VSKIKVSFSRLNIEQDHPGLATNLAVDKDSNPVAQPGKAFVVVNVDSSSTEKNIRMKKKLGFKLRWEYHDAAVVPPVEVETLPEVESWSKDSEAERP
jgi:hypothetical protein